MGKAKAQKTDQRATLARAFSSAFERKERDQPNEYGDKSFYSLKKGSPQWMTDAIREAHSGGEIFPNDWMYAACSSAADWLAETDPSSWDEPHEWADGQVDVYNTDRCRWLASHLAFGAIVDDAVKEMGHSDQGVFGDIGIGQYECAMGVVAAITRAIEAQTESDQD